MANLLQLVNQSLPLGVRLRLMLLENVDVIDSLGQYRGFGPLGNNDPTAVQQFADFVDLLRNAQ